MGSEDDVVAPSRRLFMRKPEEKKNKKIDRQEEFHFR